MARRYIELAQGVRMIREALSARASCLTPSGWKPPCRNGDLLTYLYTIKNQYGVVQTGLRFRYIPEIANDLQKYQSWNQRLGLVPADPINWAPGAQREYAFRPPAIPECSFVLRRVI
jgi:hypothetical protein